MTRATFIATLGFYIFELVEQLHRWTDGQRDRQTAFK